MNLKKHYSNLSFQAKVLLPVLALLTVLPILTVSLLNKHVAKMSLQESSETLKTAEAVFLNSLQIRDRAQREQFRNTVNEPRFKAVSQLNDADTMRAFLRDLLAEFEEEVEVLQYTSIESGQSVGVRRKPIIELEQIERDLIPNVEIALGGDLNTHISVYSDNAYNVLSIPVFLASTGYPTGALSIIVRIDESAIEELKSLTRTELVLAHGLQFLTSTLEASRSTEALQSLENNTPENGNLVQSSILSGEHYHFLSNDLEIGDSNSNKLKYVLLSSYEAKLNELRKTQYLLLGISSIGILLSVVVIWWHVRRITHPLRILKEGADAVGQGDLSHKVECDSNDECGDLAKAFNQMTDNLQTSRKDLVRTVEELRETQEQLLEREELLRESEEGLRLIIEGARDHAIFTIDDEGRTLRWNPASEQILGYSAEEAKDLKYKSLFDPEDINQSRHLLLMGEARESGQATMEGWRIRNDGTRFWADITLSKLANGKAGSGYVEITRDITARKEAETAMRNARDAAEASDRAKSEFLANMSHEFRTPMNGIIGMAGLLKSMEIPDEQEEFVDTIKTSADSLLSIIDDVLDISKIEAGELDLASQPSNLVETIKESIELLREDYEKKSIEFQLVLEDGIPAIVETDAQRLRQLIINIVGNAIKFTAKGRVLLTVGYDEAHQKICFEVQDTGIGIPEDNFEDIFKPFFQVQSSWSREYGGTGLGLSISKSIIESMNGSIRVKSAVEKGSTFTFDLEAKTLSTETADQAMGGKEAKPKVEKTAGPENCVPSEKPKKKDLKGFAAKYPQRILVVEDNPVNQKVLVNMLKRLGFAAETADNGELGVSSAEAKEFDTVLMDLQMPVMDGFESARRILASENISHPIYISAFTANARPEDKAACEEVGMHDFVAKPARMDSVQALLERAHSWLTENQKHVQ